MISYLVVMILSSAIGLNLRTSRTAFTPERILLCFAFMLLASFAIDFIFEASAAARVRKNLRRWGIAKDDEDKVE
ncbi:hypothetical protein [Polymorphobacter megasporae]|uniref:hypothetical protein n=1 Tax=Glacieibacterium megasporae TaxID=2835787 RepID=UPI001C1DD4F3|nr:hypothetical protein [Polymorphobacter megasporae]UAJ12709.1 hypothetical protein KTC28_19375 [Polymorphobacter megasporae]